MNQDEFPIDFEVTVKSIDDSEMFKAWAPDQTHNLVGMGDTPEEALKYYFEDVSLDDIEHTVTYGDRANQLAAEIGAASGRKLATDNILDIIEEKGLTRLERFELALAILEELNYEAPKRWSRESSVDGGGGAN